MKPTRKHLIILILYGLIAFACGYAAAISQCEAENRLLREDLGRAVAKGIVVQTHLNLCRDELKGTKK